MDELLIKIREAITGIYADKDLTINEKLEAIENIKGTVDLCIKDLMLQKVCRDVGIQKGIYALASERYTNNRLQK